MSIWTHRTMVVPAYIAENARNLANLFGPSAHNMWTTPLSPTGTEPATHFISAGLIQVQFAEILSSPEAMVAGCNLLGIVLPLENAEQILSVSDVSEEDAYSVMERLGLLPIIPLTEE